MYFRAERGIIDLDGHWSIIGSNTKFDREKYSLVKIAHLGRIPWRNIVGYDLDGDEYESAPHVFVRYADDGEPYEAFAYVLLGASPVRLRAEDQFMFSEDLVDP